MPAVFTMSGPMGGSDPTEDSPPLTTGPASSTFTDPGIGTPATGSSLPTPPTDFSGARLAAPPPPPADCRDWSPPPHVATYPTIPASARNPMIDSTALRMEALLAGPNGKAVGRVRGLRRSRSAGQAAAAARAARPSGRPRDHQAVGGQRRHRLAYPLERHPALTRQGRQGRAFPIDEGADDCPAHLSKRPLERGLPPPGRCGLPALRRKPARRSERTRSATGPTATPLPAEVHHRLVPRARIAAVQPCVGQLMDLARRHALGLLPKEEPSHDPPCVRVYGRNRLPERHRRHGCRRVWAD